jgi:hypothetical protein
LKREAFWKELDDHFFRRWVKSQLREAVMTMTMTSAADGFNLADMVIDCSDSYTLKWYVKVSASMAIADETSIIPAVKRSLEHMPMATAFLTSIFDDTNAFKRIDPDKAAGFFNSLVSDAVDKFDFELLQPLSKETWHSDPDGRREHERQAMIFAQTIASFLCQCKTLACVTELGLPIQRLSKEALGVEASLYPSFFLSLLKDLLTKLGDRSIVVQDTPFQLLSSPYWALMFCCMSKLSPRPSRLGHGRMWPVSAKTAGLSILS